MTTGRPKLFATLK